MLNVTYIQTNETDLLGNFLYRAEDFFVITIFFLVVAFMVYLSRNSVRKDYGEVTRTSIWKRIPGAIAGQLFSLFVLVFMVSRGENTSVAVACGLITLALFVAGLIFFRIKVRIAQKKAAESLSGSGGTSASSEPAARLSDNQVFIYILSTLSVIAKFAFVFYTFIVGIINFIIIHIQIHALYYNSLYEVLQLWDVLITAISAIAVVVFGVRIIVEISKSKGAATGNEAAAKIIRRLAR